VASIGAGGYGTVGGLTWLRYCSGGGHTGLWRYIREIERVLDRRDFAVYLLHDRGEE
jgi:hypothetical protein